MERQLSTRYTRTIINDFQEQSNVLLEYINKLVEKNDVWIEVEGLNLSDDTNCFHELSFRVGYAIQVVLKIIYLVSSDTRGRTTNFFSNNRFSNHPWARIVRT
ncbi:glycine betaine/L-proline ABC transporter [Striga asiatica]|uniref:Glycine betaine/L-proline ABC transporter n=1 Tax=Striga asiatica TaxID=4170 RepID=A0A5A7PBV7_STRAF|nr:glycine betaine/L-proline ABC transporter [Striga asiatica]